MDSKMKELIEHITTSIVFDKNTLESEEVSPDIWDNYLSLSNGKKIRKSGEYLLEIGENINGIYYIAKGKVKSDLLGKDGVVKTIGILGENCLFGEQFVFHGQPGLFEAVVIQDAELYFFDKETILEIMKKDFEITLFIIKSLAIKSRMLAIQIEDMCLRNIMQGMCRILHSLCCYKEKDEELNGDVIIYLSHQELANMLGSHRVTVTQNLNKLKKMGVLDYKYEKTIIKDREKLKEIAFE